MIYKTCATFPLDGGKVAAYAVGAVAVATHATVAVENGLAARPPPPPAAEAEDDNATAGNGFGM